MGQWSPRRLSDARDPVRVALSIASMLQPRDMRIVPDAPSKAMLDAAIRIAGITEEQARAAYGAMLAVELEPRSA